MISIGLDLGGTNIAAGLVDRQGNIISKIKIKTKPERPADAIVADMAGCCIRLIEEGGYQKEDISAVGIAAPGLIYSKAGVIISSANLPFINYPLARRMFETLSIPVKIGNDANCAALGEFYCGSGKGKENIILITIGTGIGGGLILGGKLYEGVMGLAGEIGHIVIHPDGLPCGCGRKGCSEMYLSARALARQAREAACQNPHTLMIPLCDGNPDEISARTPFIAARQGDETAARVIDTYTTYFADFLLDLIYLLRPDLILIGGGVSGEGEGLFAPLRQKLQALSKESIYGIYLPPVEAASLKNDAGIIGAAALTWDS